MNAQIENPTSELADAVTLADTPDSDKGGRLAARASHITVLAVGLLHKGATVRETWLEIGANLKEARDACGGKKAFGAWVKESGIAEIPDLEKAPARSDAIWCAEFPARSGAVPLSVVNPRSIRAAWNITYKDAIKAAIDALPDWANVVPAAMAAQVEMVCEKAGHEDPDAVRSDILDQLEALAEAMAGDGSDLPSEEADICVLFRKYTTRAKTKGLYAGDATDIVHEVFGSVPVEAPAPPPEPLPVPVMSQQERYAGVRSDLILSPEDGTDMLCEGMVKEERHLVLKEFMQLCLDKGMGGEDLQGIIKSCTWE